MKYMRAIFYTSVLSVLLAVAPSLCFGMMDIADVSKARAEELGMEIRSRAAGPDAVRVELEFGLTGELKSFSRVDLVFSEGGKILVTSMLREDRSKPGRVTVSFTGDRAHLGRLLLRVVTQPAARTMIGYELRVKEFVELDKVR